LFDREGLKTVILPVDEHGLVDLDLVKDAITQNTLVVSLQAASNEIGTIQPIKAISKLAHKAGALVHCDAAQAVGKIPVDVEEWGVDLLSFSGHKLYGPKGIGALYIRGGPHALPIKPLMFGGGQEHDLRPGTQNVPGIVGLGEACRLCMENLEEESQRTAQLRDKLEQTIINALPITRRNGAIHNRLPGNSSLTFPAIDAEALIVNTPDLAISTGSACNTGAPDPSHVLQAIGLSREEAYSTIRIGIGRFTTKEEIEQASESIILAVKRLQELQSNK
jgi:cysteine desulfurase